MMQTTLSPLCGPMAITQNLPPAPDVAAVRRQVGARLGTIETEALPALALRRAYLVRTWRAEDGVGVPVFTAAGEAILAHPVGVDRLACVLAEQEGLAHELSALRELADALDLYDAGGSSTARAIGEGDISNTIETAPKDVPDITLAGGERAYTRWMLDYLLEVKREIWAARKRRDTLRLEDLRAEFTELQARVRQHAAEMPTEARDAVHPAPLARTA